MRKIQTMKFECLFKCRILGFVLLALCLSISLTLNAQTAPAYQGEANFTIKTKGDSAIKAKAEFTLRLNANPADAGEIDIPIKNEILMPGVFALQIDQDFFFRFPFSNNEDRNYTQGTAFTYSHPGLNESIIFWPIRKLGQSQDFTLQSSSFSLGATAFTPRKLDSIAPVVGDRPFAFLLFISTSSTFFKQKTVEKRNGETKTINIFNTFTINYGMFGSNLCYEFQSFAHKSIIPGRTTTPIGWQHQISKGGSPTILIEYNRFRPLLNIPAFKDKKKREDRNLFDLGWNFGGSVGYYDRVFTGLFGRLGYLRPQNQARWNGGWSSLNSASFELLNPGSTADDRASGSKFKEFLKKVLKNTEAFGYGRINGTLMLRNSMLVGQRFKSSEYTLKPEWTKTGLIEFEWGGVLSFEYMKKQESTPRTWAVQFRQIYRSPEFYSAIFPARWHYFGSVGLLFPVR